MRRHRLVCQVLVVVLALHGALGEEPADTSSRGSGSFSVIGTGEAVRPETAAPAAPAPGAQIKSKAQYTRTAIHVARSLDPSNEETIPVRTKTGDVASIIVKRRQRTGAGNGVTAGPPPYPVRSAVAARLAKAVPGAASSVRVPDPVDIQSSTVLVKPAEEGKVQQRARSMVQVDLDNAPVIEGVRVPDDENDKKYNWRGARVINNVLVPNNGSAGLPAEPLEGAGDKARVNQPPSPPAGPPAPPRLSAGPVDTVAAAAAAAPNLPESLKLDAVKKLAESTAQSPWIPTSPDGANVVTPPLLTPQVHGLQSRAEQQRRILEYIRAVNQLEAGRAASRGRMMRNNEQSPAEARALQYQPALLYSAQSTNPTRVVSFEEGVRTPVLQYAHPELGVQPAKVAPPAPPAPARNQDRALAYFGQDIHADRSPFAREPGLDQPEEPTKPTSAKRSSPDAQTLAVNAASTATSTGLSSLPQRPKKVQPIEDSYGLASDKYIKRFPHAASYKDYRDYKDDYGHGYRYNSYRADPHYSSYSPSPFLEDARPFWVRLSDSIQDSMRTGMERMSDLARPVVDPLVEASAKISQNLGFTSGGANGVGGATRGAHGAQDRLGSVGAAVATPSMLLPALGLVAGGAALGLGAVAVGRYLDVDVMAKRSEASDEDDEDALEMEHKRALNALRAGQQRYLDASHTDGLDGRQVTDAEVVAQVIDVVNKQQHKQQQQQHHHQHQHQQAHSRTRRDSSANTLDSFELAEERRQLALRAAQLGAPTAVWGSTPCAQRVFCDVLSREGPDSALLMEKKMATLLAMLPRVAPEAAAVHLSAVMGAVRRGDCSVFVCPLTSAPRR